MGELFAGRYEFVEPVGHGGMGTVWIVWDVRDRVHRAAKLLRQADAGSLIRFVREQALRIDHDHCVTPRGWSAEDDRVLFTMDLVRGGSVHDLLGDYGALPAAWAATLLDQLLLALEAVHGAGIVHRDVKPANLLLEPTGRGRPHLRLGDFGIAAALHEPRLTQAATVLGTPGYRAPEQLAGADPRPAQDLWAAGVVLVEMLTGQRPPNEVSVLAESGPPGVDKRLWWLAYELTRHDPALRPGSAKAARELLATTGLVAAADAPPDDEGAEIEVLEHLSVPGAPSPVPSPPVTPAPESSAYAHPERDDPEHPDRGRPEETPVREAEQSVPARTGRSAVAVAGWFAIATGVVLLGVALLMLR